MPLFQYAGFRFNFNCRKPHFQYTGFELNSSSGCPNIGVHRRVPGSGFSAFSRRSHYPAVVAVVTMAESAGEVCSLCHFYLSVA